MMNQVAMSGIAQPQFGRALKKKEIEPLEKQIEENFGKKAAQKFNPEAAILLKEPKAATSDEKQLEEVAEDYLRVRAALKKDEKADIFVLLKSRNVIDPVEFSEEKESLREMVSINIEATPKSLKKWLSIVQVAPKEVLLRLTGRFKKELFEGVLEEMN